MKKWQQWFLYFSCLVAAGSCLRFTILNWGNEPQSNHFTTLVLFPAFAGAAFWTWRHFKLTFLAPVAFEDSTTNRWGVINSHFRKRVPDSVVVESVASVLGIDSARVFISWEGFPAGEDLSSAVVLEFNERPAGFRLAVDIWTTILKQDAEVFAFLSQLAVQLDTDIFIDESDTTGKLFTAVGEIRDVSYRDGDVGDELYIELNENTGY